VSDSFYKYENYIRNITIDLSHAPDGITAEAFGHFNGTINGNIFNFSDSDYAFENIMYIINFFNNKLFNINNNNEDFIDYKDMDDQPVQMIEGCYQKKYLKYKQKYIELKEKISQLQI